jgi:hypothetical protein
MTMPTAQTTEPARVVASNAHARRQAAAKAASDDLFGDRPDATTPLGEAPAPAAEPPKKPAPAIVLSFQTIYRGRLITITGEHMTLDQFCDLLDARLGVAS